MNIVKIIIKIISNVRKNNCNCHKCLLDPPGSMEQHGPTGAQGESGRVLNFAYFYVLISPNNVATIPTGTDVSFPQDGPNSGSGISRTEQSSFNLAQIGTYQILFQVSTNEAVN